MKNDIYNALRAVLLILIFAIGTTWCITEKSMSAGPAEPEQLVEAPQPEELPTIDVAEQIKSVETKMAKVRAAVVEAAPIVETDLELEPAEDPSPEPEPAPAEPETIPEPEPVEEEPAPEADPAPAAQPTIRYALTDEERKIVEAVVAAEAGGEDFDGQALVAQCILNTAEAKGMRPDDVVLAPKQYTTPNYERRSLVEDAVAAVFDEGYTVTDEPIQYFYAPELCSSKWHESQRFVIEHGCHRFFMPW